MTIATDKILSEEERKSIEMDFRVEGFSVPDMQKLISSEFQLAALCREQQKWIQSANGSLRDDSHAPGYSELIVEGESLLAAFPETLKQST